MSDQIQREVQVPAPADAVWEAVIGNGWLADEVSFELVPGGDATFRSSDGASVRSGWVEDVCAPQDARGGPARLTFWWAQGEEPASRVELTIIPAGAPDRSGDSAPAGAPGRSGDSAPAGVPGRSGDSAPPGAPGRSGVTVVRVVETRPLDRLDLVGIPLRRAGGGQVYGPALVAA